MNRLVFILLATVGWVCSTVSAEEYAAKVLDSNYFNVIPGFLSSDGKPYVYTADWIYDGNYDDEYDSVHCILFDDDFNKVKEFNLEMPIFSEKIYSQRAEKVYDAIIPGQISEEVEEQFDGMSTEELLVLMKSWDMDCSLVKLEDGREVIAFGFWEEGMYGKTYPSDFFMQKDDQWYSCEREYTADSHYDWGEVEEQTINRSKSLMEVNYMQEDGTGGEGKFFRDRFSCLTRGIFGDFITYIQPICEEVPFERIGETYKEWGTNNLANGFEVYDLNKKLITSIKLPSGLYIYGSNIDFLNLSGKKYIVVLATTKEGLLIEGTHNGDESIVIYSLDKQTKATQIAIAPVGKVSPRDPRKGETVTVTVDDKYSNEGCIVNVVSTEGRTMLRRQIAPGENSIQFNTDSFPQGVYIVTFSGKSGKSEAAKIIVR